MNDSSRPVAGDGGPTDPTRRRGRGNGPSGAGRTPEEGPIHRIVVLGAESTGTTTLVGDLADRLSAPSVPEFLRQYAHERAAEAGSIWAVTWATEDFDTVADGQDRLEDETRGRWTSDPGRGPSAPVPLLVCDTDALATAIWHRRYVGSPAPRFLRRAKERPVALYVLTPHEGVAFEQDGLRDGEHIREEMTEWFREALRAQDVPWIEVAGTEAERVEQALEAIGRLVPGPVVRK